MKLEYQINFADYREASQVHHAPRSAVKRWLVAAVFLLLIVCVCWQARRPVQVIPTGQAGAPVPLGEALQPIIVLLPWIGVVYIVLIIAAIRPVTSQRKFTRALGAGNRWFSAPVLLIGAIALAGSSSIIATAREPIVGANGSIDNAGVWWLPWLVVLGAVCMIIFGRAYRRNWKQQPGLARPRTLEYSPASVTSDDGLICSIYCWPAFLRCTETKNFFLLYPSGLGFLIVPKRAFPSVEAADGFRRLIEEWADGRSVGFPVIQAGSPNSENPIPRIKSQ